MKTTQSTVARLESGRGKPSTRTLSRFAKATGHRLKISFEPVRGRGGNGNGKSRSAVIAGQAAARGRSRRAAHGSRRVTCATLRTMRPG